MFTRVLLFAIATIAMTAIGSCNSNGNNSGVNISKVQEASGDSTLCQFNNLDMDKQFSYVDDDGDTLYCDNSFSAFWPQMINGKPCPNLQQALLHAMTDSAELNTLDKAVDFLLNPGNYTDYDVKRFTPVTEVKDNGKLSTSEVDVIMQSMTDRLLLYHLGTYSYMAGGAHGIYANNYVTYDLKTEKAVTLAEIIADTTLLRTVTFKAIKQAYDYDKDDLFIPDNGLLPLPGDFYIEGSVLHVVYQVYEIASYAQGDIDVPLIYPNDPSAPEYLTSYGKQVMEESLAEATW